MTPAPMMHTSCLMSWARPVKSREPVDSMGSIYSSIRVWGKVAPTTVHTADTKMHPMTRINRYL